MVFGDTSRCCEYAKLSVLTGIRVGPLQNGLLFHTQSWLTHKSRRPVVSTAAAEILAVGDAIDEGKTLCDTVNILLRKV